MRKCLLALLLALPLVGCTKIIEVVHDATVAHAKKGEEEQKKKDVGVMNAGPQEGSLDEFNGRFAPVFVSGITAVSDFINGSGQERLAAIAQKMELAAANMESLQTPAEASPGHAEVQEFFTKAADLMLNAVHAAQQGNGGAIGTAKNKLMTLRNTYEGRIKGTLTNSDFDTTAFGMEPPRFIFRRQ